MSPGVRAGEILLKTDIGDALGLQLPAAALLNLLRHSWSLSRTGGTHGCRFLGGDPRLAASGVGRGLVPISTLWVKPILS